jgi:hypothetical protein
MTETEPSSRSFQLSAQAEKAQYSNNDDDETDDIDDIIHAEPPCLWRDASQTVIKTPKRLLPLLQQPVSYQSAKTLAGFGPLALHAATASSLWQLKAQTVSRYHQLISNVEAFSAAAPPFLIRVGESEPRGEVFHLVVHDCADQEQ